MSSAINNVIDIFFSKESNSGDKYIDGRCENPKRNGIVSITLPSDIEPHAAAIVAYAKEIGALGKGSSRTGAYEVQTDAGIFERSGSQAKAAWSFRTWDDLIEDEIDAIDAL